MLTEVEEIVKSLKEKHGTKYSTEQLNIWAHVLHLEKHDSREVPPNVPYFTRNKTPAEKGSQPSRTADQAPKPLGPPSPGKRVSMRSECISQLKNWHSLLEQGVIAQAVYDKVQQTILKDIMWDS